MEEHYMVIKDGKIVNTIWASPRLTREARWEIDGKLIRITKFQYELLRACDGNILMAIGELVNLQQIAENQA